MYSYNRNLSGKILATYMSVVHCVNACRVSKFVEIIMLVRMLCACLYTLGIICTILMRILRQTAAWLNFYSWNHLFTKSNERTYINFFVRYFLPRLCVGFIRCHKIQIVFKDVFLEGKWMQYFVHTITEAKEIEGRRVERHLY